MTTHPRLLVFGEAAIPSGTARVTTTLLTQLAARWDIQCCAARWPGDAPYPSPYPYTIYRADLAGDEDRYGVRRYTPLVTHLEPQCVLLICEIAVARQYLVAHNTLPSWPSMERPPVVAYVPVRGVGSPDVVYLNECALVVTPTLWGAQQLRRDGYKGPLTVLAPGVDLSLFFPRPRDEARAHFGMEALATPQTTIIGTLQKNLLHHRLDTAVLGFASWVQTQHLEDHAYLWLQCTNQGEPWERPYPGAGWDLQHLARQYGMEGNLLMPPADLAAYGGALADEELSWLYSAWDLSLAVSADLGWGCSVLEAQACGIPVLLPQDMTPSWPPNDDGALSVAPLPSYMPSVDPVSGMLQGLVHPETVAKALDGLLHGTAERQRLREAGLRVVQEERFRWEAVAAQMDACLRAVVQERAYDVSTIGAE